MENAATAVDLEALQKELKVHQERADRAEQTLNDLRLDRALESFISDDTDVIYPKDVAVLIKDQVGFDPATGRITGADSALAKLKKAKPYLTHSGSPHLAGQATSRLQTAQDTDDERIPKLFGKNADPIAANNLARKDIGEYRRLKKVAQERRLIV